MNNDKETVDYLQSGTGKSFALALCIILFVSIFLGMVCSITLETNHKVYRMLANIFACVDGLVFTAFSYFLLDGLRNRTVTLSTPLMLLTGVFGVWTLWRLANIFIDKDQVVIDAAMGIAACVVGLIAMIMIISNYRGRLQEFAKLTLLCPILTVISLVIIIILTYIVEEKYLLRWGLIAFVASISGYIRASNKSDGQIKLWKKVGLTFLSLTALGLLYGGAAVYLYAGGYKFENAMYVLIVIGVMIAIFCPLRMLVVMLTDEDAEEEYDISIPVTPIDDYNPTGDPQGQPPYDDDDSTRTIDASDYPAIPPDATKPKSEKILVWIIIVFAVILVSLVGTLIWLKLTEKPAGGDYDEEGLVMVEDSTGDVVDTRTRRADASKIQVRDVSSLYGHQLSQNGQSYVEENLVDGNPATAYSIEESRVINTSDDIYGSENDPPTLTFRTNGKPVDFMVIYNGYQKSQSTYYNNCRPRDISVSAWYGDNYVGQLYAGKLKDINSPQRVNFKPLKDRYNRIVLEFNPYDMYSGEKYRDICISEVEFYGNANN